MELAYINALHEERKPFVIENVERNVFFMQSKQFSNIITSNTRVDLEAITSKTGTTICGLVVQNAVLLASDTRATSYVTVSDKNCQKIRMLAKNIYCAGAGLAADIIHLPAMIQAKLELLRLSLRSSEVRVTAAVTMMQQHLAKYNGALKSYFIIGGVDCKGAHLYKIHAHGSVEKAPFCSLGSGCFNALSYLETQYKNNLTSEEGFEIIKNAVRAGIINDLGSGSNVDVVVIKRSQQDLKLGVQKIEPRKIPIEKCKLEKVMVISKSVEYLDTIPTSSTIFEDIDMSDS